VNPLLILATALLISGPAYVLDGDTVWLPASTSASRLVAVAEGGTVLGEVARQVIIGDGEHLLLFCFHSALSGSIGLNILKLTCSQINGD